MRRRACFLLGVAWLAGCGQDGSIAPPPPPPNPPSTAFTISLISGSGQHGVAGEVLPIPVTVEVRDEAGRLAAGIPILFQAESGEGANPGTQNTNGSGRASSLWRLSWTPGEQGFVAGVSGSPAAAVRVIADAAVSPRAEVVLVRGAGENSSVVAVLEGQLTPELHFVAPHDTTVYLAPRSTPPPNIFPWVVAFSVESPPAITAELWTDRPDTVPVAFGAPFRIPLTVWVLEDFPRNSAIARGDVDATARFWQILPWGLEPGPLRIEDATQFAGMALSCAAPLPVVDSAAINIYYAANAQIAQFAGFTCSNRTILIKPALSRPGQLLLAHELGHAFGLGHAADQTNFMNPTTLAGRATGGQIFNSHFSPFSAINALFHLRPAAQLNACCLPETFGW